MIPTLGHPSIWPQLVQRLGINHLKLRQSVGGNITIYDARMSTVASYVPTPSPYTGWVGSFGPFPDDMLQPPASFKPYTSDLPF